MLDATRVTCTLADWRARVRQAGYSIGSQYPDPLKASDAIGSGTALTAAFAGTAASTRATPLSASKVGAWFESERVPSNKAKLPAPSAQSCSEK